MRHPWLMVLVGLAVWLAGSPRARAANDPDLDWWTLETAHFRIHYEKGLEPAAERIARLSEDIHNRLIGPFGYVPDQKTEVALTDNVDSANGSATAIPFNTVRLFITAPGDLSTLSDYDDWYLGLMTHEYTHILHVDNVSGLPSIVNAVLGKTLVPNQVQPRWLIEGIAVVAESRYTSSGRIRSTLFDTYIRADFVDDRVATLDQISSNARRWPMGNLWYLYGSRFVQWITDVYGLDIWRAVIADYSSNPIPFGINRSIRRQTGKTYAELYDGFVDHHRRRYQRQMRAVKKRGLREGRRVTFHGREVYYPKFVPKAARRDDGGRYQLVYYRDDQNERPGIYHLDLTRQPDDEPGDVPDETLWARANGEGPVSFTPEGHMLFSSTVPYRRVYRRQDLFEIPKGETAPRGMESYRKRRTEGLRATAPAVSPNGKLIAFTRNVRGTTSLVVAKRADDGKIIEPKIVYRGRDYDQVYTPVFSPDGRTIAVSTWSAGGFRDIRLFDVATGKMSNVTYDRALDQNPTWSPSGKILYFASDRTGISNIYAYRLKDHALKQVTNTRLGAFQPAVSDDGKVLAYVGYTSYGFDLWALKLDPKRYLDALPPPNDRPAPQPEPPTTKMEKRPYNPLPTLRPYSYFLDTAQGNFGTQTVTLTAEGADIAGHHAFAASLLADPGAPLPMLTFDYRYLRLPFDLSLRLSNRVLPRQDFRFNDQRLEYNERSYGMRTGISYTHLGEFSQQSIGFSYGATITDADLPIRDSTPFDPYASLTITPLEGLVTSARLSYSFSNVEGSFDTAGAPRGISVALSAELGDEALGSQDSIYSLNGTVTGYIEVPWGKWHTLAVRTAGGMSKGTFTQRGTFFVGGYNLDNVSFLDMLLDGSFNGSFVLRGYDPGSYRGSSFILQNLEYRFPIAFPDRGLLTVPLFLRRLDANLFMDYGGAFDDIGFDQFGFFRRGAIIDAPTLHSAAGAELWAGLTAAHSVNIQMRLGYAYGFSPEAIPGGRGYFIASSAF